MYVYLIHRVLFYEVTVASALEKVRPERNCIENQGWQLAEPKDMRMSQCSYMSWIIWAFHTRSLCPWWHFDIERYVLASNYPFDCEITGLLPPFASNKKYFCHPWPMNTEMNIILVSAKIIIYFVRYYSGIFVMDK